MPHLLVRIFLTALLLATAFFPALAQSTKVLLKTDAGDITIELYDVQAPITTANFLHYIDEGRFVQASFYRVLKPDNQPKDSTKIGIVQGGIAPNFGPALPAITHESTQQTGIMHTDGTISMVRQAPGSARSEFFICVGDQPDLNFGGKRNPDGKGFAAFGKVIAGMEVVKKIYQLPLQGQLLAQPVKIISFSRIK